MYNKEFCLTGKELKEATYEDAKKFAEQYEKFEFENCKRMGLLILTEI